jgi:ribonuclease-3
MEQFPTASEGELSRLRALIVNEDGLAKVARACGLGDLLLLGKGEERTGGRTKSSVLADAFEAVLGAIYLTCGLPGVLELVDRLFAESLAGVASGRNGLDYKTRLQEQSQTRVKLPPRYRVVSESGPDHDKVFEVEVLIGEELYARASGKSKKEAEQAAAQKALELLSARDTPR